MNRSIIDRFNTINDFLIDIENYDIIMLSKPDLNNELIEIDIL